MPRPELPEGFVTLGLQDGDLIVGIGDQNFDNYKQMVVAFQTARFEKSARIHIIRGRVAVILQGSVQGLWVGSPNLVPVLR